MSTTTTTAAASLEQNAEIDLSATPARAHTPPRGSGEVPRGTPFAVPRGTPKAPGAPRKRAAAPPAKKLAKRIKVESPAKSGRVRPSPAESGRVRARPAASESVSSSGEEEEEEEPTTSDEEFIDHSIFDEWRPQTEDDEKQDEHDRTVNWIANHPEFNRKLAEARKRYNDIAKRAKYQMDRDDNGHFFGHTPIIEIGAEDGSRASRKHCKHNAQGGGICDSCAADLYFLYEEANDFRTEVEHFWKEGANDEVIEDEASQAQD